ncbi:MAG: EpsG family protein [Clostridia bacterium]|nr:EpsG family protein [Clostridia bacterium]
MVYSFGAHLLVLLAGAVMIRKHPKKFYILATAILSLLSYFVIATENMDLFRYIRIMEYIRAMGFDWGMDTYGPSNPLAFIFFYGISLFENDAMLPAVAVATTYGFSFALLYKASKRLNASTMDTYIALVFFMLNMNYCYVIDVVRIYMAFAIMAYFLYMDIVEKKHRIFCFVVYAALCYFHYAMMVFVILRIILIITRRFKGVLAAIVSLLVPVVVFVAYKFVEGFSGESLLFSVANDKLLGYKDYTVFGVWQFAASMIRCALFVALCLFAFWLCSNWKYELANKTLGDNSRETVMFVKRNSDLVMYTLYIVFTVFVFITNYQFVLRVPYFAQIFMSFVLLLVMTRIKKIDYQYHTFVSVIIILESVAHFGYLLLYVYKNLTFTF